jgi:hypothetical protein
VNLDDDDIAPEGPDGLEELAEEYGVDPAELIAPPVPTASHLSAADEALLASVTGRSSHKGIGDIEAI